MNESALKVILELGPKYGVDLWKHVQYKYDKKWRDCMDVSAFDPMYFGEYRVKPRTHTVNGTECPAPMSEKPEIQEEYWYIPKPSVKLTTWCDTESDRILFDGGIFKIKEDALANFYAHYPHMKPEAE